MNASISNCYAFNALTYQKKVDKHCSFLQTLIKKKVLNDCMAKIQMEVR